MMSEVQFDKTAGNTHREDTVDPEQCLGIEENKILVVVTNVCFIIQNIIRDFTPVISNACAQIT